MSVSPIPGSETSSIPAETLDPILVAASDLGASDIHLSANAAPLIRLNGDLVALPGYTQALSGEWLEQALLRIMGPDKRAAFAAEREVDLSYALPHGRRVRVNVFRQYGGIAAAMRLLPERIPSLEDLGIPAVAAHLALRPRGLVLVVGAAGSGKSTTLAAMIDLVNRERCGHIISVEDPIEYRHYSRNCLVHQREIGADTDSFGAALRHILRQDPDVVMIGELRDSESISIALTAAETGQLVLGTLHTQGAAKTIDRIIDSFPPGQQTQIRSQLSDTLRGVISQTLLPRADGSGRVLATEVLVHTDAVGNLIREAQLPQLQTVMQTSSQLGMHTLDQSLQDLVRRGVVAREVAAEYASDSEALDGVLVDQTAEPISAAKWGV